MLYNSFLYNYKKNRRDEKMLFIVEKMDNNVNKTVN